jgi:hypothetical protein
MKLNHMLKYHVVLPLGVFVVLLVAGVSAGTALVVAMMTGCLSMALMMGGHHSGHDDHATGSDDHRTHRP